MHGQAVSSFFPLEPEQGEINEIKGMVLSAEQSLTERICLNPSCKQTRLNRVETKDPSENSFAQVGSLERRHLHESNRRQHAEEWQAAELHWRNRDLPGKMDMILFFVFTPDVYYC